MKSLCEVCGRWVRARTPVTVCKSCYLKMLGEM